MSSSEIHPTNFLIPMEEINRATQYLTSRNLNEGNRGYRLYRGQLSESWGNRTVDIFMKLIYSDWEKDEWSARLKIASSFHHKNIITFIGYCFEGKQLFQVQEHAINENLYDYLKDENKKCNLTWPQRLNICISAAKGLKHLHDGRVIHRDFSSKSILLYENLEAKITNFDSLVFVPESHSHLHKYNSYGRSYKVVVDPIYKDGGILNLESNVYLYGLVLFQVLSGILYDHPSHIGGYDKHYLIYFVRRFYDDDLLQKLIDPSLNDQVNHHSFAKFTQIAYRCISFNIKDRPTMDEIIKTLEEALELHINQAAGSTGMTQSLPPLDKFLLTMKEIDNSSAITKINDEVYRGHSYSYRNNIALRPRFEKEFRHELQIFSELRHDNIIRFIGYNDEYSNMIIASEKAVNGALDNGLSHSNNRKVLTWEKRLKICIGAARGLKYLHFGLGEYKCVIHGNFHSGKILLDDKFEAKIHDFSKSALVRRNGRSEGTFVDELPLENSYLDPVYSESQILKSEADVYSFGVVLFEIISKKFQLGVSGYSGLQKLPMDEFRHYHESLIDPDIIDQIDPRSLDTFKEIANRCISYNPKDRPSMITVVKRLEEALYIQKQGAAPTITRKNRKLEDFKIPLDEIKSAIGIEGQQTCIGTGGFGKVYQGKLPGRWKNRTVAIKHLIPNAQMELNFQTEIKMIFNFNHQNIIPFLGYCDEGSEKMMVFEFAVNGSLDDYLLKEDKRRSLTWTQRLKICLGAARGIDYLHSGLGEHKRIIHRDVKSGNILLDGNLEAKICDFGLSKSDTTIDQPATHENTFAAGTNFYMDPVYYEGGVLRKESDVYSFGVVMFELLSGMLVYDNRSFEDGKPAQPLLYQVRRYYDQTPKTLIDPFIREEIKTRSFNAFKNIAIQCISFNSKERPTMEQIVDQLEEALRLQDPKQS